MSEHLIRRVVIHGRVQGVGFRDWTRRVARGRGLEGWVRNRADGSVEALFAGPAEAVAGMIRACRTGPPNARLERVDEYDASSLDLDLRRPGEGFSVLASV